MTKAILATLAALAWALPATAEEASSSPMTAAQMGADLYQNYCATCHGKSAAGDGPLSEYFTTQVPALTQLSAKNGGEFPLARVVHLIDGGQQMPFHRGAMPSFGPDDDRGDRRHGRGAQRGGLLTRANPADRGISRKHPKLRPRLQQSIREV